MLLSNSHKTFMIQKSLLTVGKSSKRISPESSDAESSGDEAREFEPMAMADLPPEYWQVQKLVKYLKSGNQTATVLALCSLLSYDLSKEMYQGFIKSTGGLEVLINLLETKDTKCKLGALRILKYLSRNPDLRRQMWLLGTQQLCVDLLAEPAYELQTLSAETMANIAQFRKARRQVRHHGGIPRLLDLMDLDDKLLMDDPLTLQLPDKRRLEAARAGAKALCSLSPSAKNKEAIRRAGGIPVLARLLRSRHNSLMVAVVATLQECSTEERYRLAVRSEGMVVDLVRHLREGSPRLKQYSAAAIFKCAVDVETKEMVRVYGGLEPLLHLLAEPVQDDDRRLLWSVTGALWRCAEEPASAAQLERLGIIGMLVDMMQSQTLDKKGGRGMASVHVEEGDDAVGAGATKKHRPQWEEVLVNVVGILGQCALQPTGRQAIRGAGGLPFLVGLLTATHAPLLVNVANVVGHCARDQEGISVIDARDGIRLLWSLLKNPHTNVQASAAAAICPCIHNLRDSADLVRSFVGGLELLVGLLNSKCEDVLSNVCEAISYVAQDMENLAVITDHGVVLLLAQLAYTDNEKLRRNLSEAIANCCAWGSNRKEFGRRQVVTPLVCYLTSQDPDVHRAATRALYQLSKCSSNCVDLHQNGAVPFLLNMVGSPDPQLQEAAAGCLSNIRKLALLSEIASEMDGSK